MEAGFITKTHLEESKMENDDVKLDDEGKIARAKQILGSAWKGAGNYASKGYSYLGGLT